MRRKLGTAGAEMSWNLYSSVESAFSIGDSAATDGGVEFGLIIWTVRERHKTLGSD
jgi:hypothetical protein